MTTKDIIFKTIDSGTAQTNPNSFCHFGWEGTGAYAFFRYAEAYYESAEALFEQIQKSTSISVIDGLGIAMCFSYRHYVELMIKFLNVQFVCKNEADYKDLLNRNHNLTELWNATRPTLKDLRDRVGSSVKLGVVDHYIEEINRFDNNSMSMRYPVDKKLNKMHPEMNLDLINLHDRMNELYYALLGLASDLDHQLLDVNLPEEDIKLFSIKYSSLKNRVSEILSNLSEFESKETQDEIVCFSPFEMIDRTLTKPDSLLYLESLPDDEIIMLDSLYYVGRDIKQGLLNLPLNKSAASTDVIKSCLLGLKRDNLEFGKPKNENINIYGKSLSSIIEYVSEAMSHIEI